MSVVVEGKPGATERSYCYEQRTTTTFYWTGAENHTAPRVDFWSCASPSCGWVRTAMFDISDSESFVRSTVTRMVKTTSTVDYGDVRSLDFDDLVSEGWELLWQLYTKWSPTLNPSFTSYATFYLPRRLVRWWRRTYGPSGHKPLGSAVSLDAPVGSDDSSEDGPGGGDSGTLRSVVGDARDLPSGLVLRTNLERAARRRQRLGARNGAGANPDAAR